jgi:cytoskeleton protein RodZ
MGSFGDKLKREREMRGVTLDEISESTKIARRHLEALETEDFGSLPGGVFNKGFVRAYAHFIGIDEDEAVADYAAVSHEAPPPEDQFPLEVHEKPNRELNPRKSQMPIVAAAAVLVVVMAGAFVWRKHHPHGGVLPAVAASSGDTNDQKRAGDEPSAQNPPEATRSESKSSESRSKMVRVKETVAERQPEEKAEAASAARHTPGVEKPLSSEHSFFVIIKAKEDAWISVVADGRHVSRGILRADKQRFVRAARQIVLTTGNAGGIDVYFNGKALGAIGNESEARTLMFTPTGAAQQ